MQKRGLKPKDIQTAEDLTKLPLLTKHIIRQVGEDMFSNGHSLDTIIEKVNRTTKGWFEYFKHSNRRTFGTVDGWIRMRLRSILRHRRRGRGRGRGRDHQRWPNAFFAERGLFTLAAAYAKASQSPPG